MKLKDITQVGTEEEARQIAIRFQNEMSKTNRFTTCEESEYFEELGNFFGIREEFKENGII